MYPTATFLRHHSRTKVRDRRPLSLPFEESMRQCRLLLPYPSPPEAPSYFPPSPSNAFFACSKGQLRVPSSRHLVLPHGVEEILCGRIVLKPTECLLWLSVVSLVYSGENVGRQDVHPASPRKHSVPLGSLRSLGRSRHQIGDPRREAI